MSFAGDWKVTVNSPMGSQQGTLTLTEADGALSGKFDGPQGVQEFDGGTVDGNTAAWKIKMTSPMPMELEFDANVDGDALTGNVKLGAFGSATFEGTRA